VIDVAFKCAVLRIPFDSTRLLTEPPADYLLGLTLLIERVSAHNRAENERAEAQLQR
jgi:hypothetical protein